MEASKADTTLDIACTNGLKGMLLALDGQIRAKTGLAYTVNFASTKKMVDDIAGGATPDVAIAAQEAIDELIAGGRLASPRIDIARSTIGVAVRTGTPHPDIRTVDAFFAALKAAPSISRSRLGMSGQHLVALLDRYGLAAELTPKIKVYDAYAAQACANGETDIAIQQISELLPVQGLDIVGPLPEAIQKVTIFSGGFGASTRRRGAAQTFMDYLTGKDVAPLMRSHGLEPI